MAKKSFKLDDVEFTLSANEIDKGKAQDVLKDLQKMLEQEDEVKEPKNPKEYKILLADPEGLIPQETLDRLVGWVIEILEGEDDNLVLQKISLSAAQHNQTRAGQKLPLTTVGETLEVAKRTIMKENEIWTKTKEPVRVLSTDNKLIDLVGEE